MFPIVRRKGNKWCAKYKNIICLAQSADGAMELIEDQLGYKTIYHLEIHISVE